MALKELQVMVVEDHGFQRRIAVRLLAELGVVKVLEGPMAGSGVGKGTLHALARSGEIP